MRVRVLMFTILAAAVFAPASQAHHSFAMFDNTKLNKLSGTVKEFEHINPHAWVHLTVAGAGARPVTWSFEMGSVSQLVRDGWNQSTVKAGDRVTVAFHPLKDGSNGGQFRSVVFEDGREMCQAGAGNRRCQTGQLPAAE